MTSISDLREKPFVGRIWKTAKLTLICGYCLASITKSANYLEITLPRVKRVRIRCEKCAERDQ
jgi:hypothetical protein